MSVRILVAGIVTFGSILAAWLWVHSTMARIDRFAVVAAQLPLELTAARNEGLPLQPADLRPKTPIPPELNAAPLYRQINLTLRALPKEIQDEDKNVLDFVRARKPDKTALASRIISRRSRELALAEKAARLPYCSFDRAWEQGPDLRLPEYASMRQIARLLAARAILQADSGELEQAFNSIRLGAKVGRHAGEDPMLIAMLVNIAIYAIMDEAFQDVIYRHRDSVRAIELADQAMDFPPLPPISHSFRSEVVTGRVTVKMVRRDPSSVERAVSLLARKPDTRNTLCDAWEARMLQYWRECFRVLKSGSDDPVAQARALKALGDDLVAHEKEPTYELAAILVPVFSQVALKVASARERQRLRKALIQLIGYRERTGQWPAALAQLPGPVEPDIFTGKPPIYRQIPQGFILYSVGDDFKDDGGQSKRDRKTGALDLVVLHAR